MSSTENKSTGMALTYSAGQSEQAHPNVHYSALVLCSCWHRTHRTLQRRGIVFRPGDEDDEQEYTTSLLSFYQQIVLYPLDWGMDELTEKLMEIEHRRLDAAVE